MHPGRVLVVAALCVLAGCAGAPAETPTDELAIEYQVSNEGSSTVEVLLAVAPTPLEGVRVTFANGTVREYAVGRIGELPPGTVGDATTLDLIGEEPQTRRLSVQPRTGFGGTFENVTGEGVAVYTVRRPGAGVVFRGWGEVRCSGSGRMRIDLRIDADDTIAAGVACT